MARKRRQLRVPTAPTVGKGTPFSPTPLVILAQVLAWFWSPAVRRRRSLLVVTPLETVPTSPVQLVEKVRPIAEPR